MADVKILLVEDESIEAMDIKSALESFGYKVPCVVSSGEEVLKKALDIIPDLILMDIVLKGDSDGIGAVSKIKDLNIPVIYLTAHSEESMVKKTLVTEPYGYLLKPFDRTELNFTIELALYKNKMEKLLIKSEKSYRELAENIPGIVYRVLLRKNMQMQFFNEMVNDMTGFAPDELVKGEICSIDPLIISEDRENVLKTVQSSIISKKDFLVDYRIKHKNGSIRYFRERGNPIYGDEGEPLYIDGVIFDITTQKESELKIKDANKKWEDTFNAIEDSICLLDAEGTLLQCNAKTETLLKKPSEKFIGRKCWEVVHGTDKPIDNCPVVKMWKSKKRETSLLHIDDKWFKITVDPIFDESGSLTSAVHVLTDITARKRSENEKEELLKESQRVKDELSILIENIVDEVWFCNKQGDIILANAAARKFEQNANLEDDKSLNGLIKSIKVYDSDGRPRPREGSALLRSLNGEVITDLEEIVIFPGSDEKHYRQVSSAPIKNKNGEITGAVAVVRDITRQKTDENEIIRAKEDWERTFDAVPDLIAIIDKNYKIIRANKAMANKLGVHPEDAVGLTCYQAVQGMNNPINSCPHKKLLKDQSEHTVEIREDRLKGDYLVSVSPLYDPGGKLMGSVHVAHDITQQKKSEKELEKSVSRFRALAEYSVDGIITTNVQGKILYFNNSLMKMFGYTHEELENSPLTILMPERYRENFIESLKKFRATGEHHLAGRTIETLGIKKDGNEFPFEMSLTKWEADEKIYFTSIIRNITERKKSEKALKESEEKFKSLVDNAADILLVHDFDGKIMDVNKRACESLGYSTEELLQMNIMDIEQDVDLKHAQEKVWPKIKPDEPFSLLGHLRRKDGSIFPVEVRFAVVDIHDQRLFMGLARDITERLKMEISLKESEKRLFDIIDFLPDATFAIDDNGIIITWNKAIEDMTGFKSQDMMGKGNYEYSLPFYGIKRPILIDLVTHSNEDIEKHYEYVERMGEAIMAQTEAPLKGTNRILWGKAVLLHDGQGNIKGAIEVIRDITDRVKAENEIIESLKEKELLIREIHHRVKNNMQIISSLLNLQIQHVEDQEAENVLKESQGRVKSMAMVHEKLYQSASFTNINFKEYIERLVFDIFYSYGIKKGTIESVLNIEDISIGIETAIPLGLIINELVTNSVKYAFPKCKGIILIEFESSGDELELIVADDGVGLPEDIQIENTETLGLQLVNNLINQIDGEVELDRSNGTKFKITFKELEYKKRI